MRILIVNDGFDAGGVQSYLDAVMRGLEARGHALAMLLLNPISDSSDTLGDPPRLRFSVADQGIDGALRLVREWDADVGFSHNMNALDVDRRLIDEMPVVKFMHGYLGTCIGGLKRHAFPAARPCHRTFGAPCLALYLPRHCGQLSLVKLIGHYRWANRQHQLITQYRAIVVASDHMKREYLGHGADPNRVHVNPLFPTHHARPEAPFEPLAPPTVVFSGRMTALKGGDLLVRAVAEASRRLTTPLHLTMIGDGPQRPEWEHLASRLSVSATFAGWQTGDARWRWLRGASLLAVPSTWPEPFGLVGLEAGALGVPAIAFDVGGVRQWLHAGENGYLVAGDPPRASALADGLVAALGQPETLAAMRHGAIAVARRMSIARHLDRLEEILAGDAVPHAHSAGR